MRKAISTAVMACVFAAGAAASVHYVYVMWGLDWGPMMTHGHNLMLVLTMFGTAFVFLIVLLLFGFVATLIDPELGQRV